ncbi:Transcriptional repressor IclR [Sporomusa rhizae]|uniref:IclR family transcriptional regulator n=1 Tax=Sporomusa rhizae TaxID=357999 RepID=UPI00352AE473
MAGDGSVSSLHRAIDILFTLQLEGKEMGVTEIARAVSLPKSTVFRLLSTLESRGFIKQNTENGKYWLGIKLYSLGKVISDKMRIKTVAAPHAKALSQKFNEVCNVAVLDMVDCSLPKQIIIEKVQSQQLLTLTPPEGSSGLCHCSGAGKCLLAYSPQSFLEKFAHVELPRCTKKTIVDWDILREELAEIRKRGYAIDEEELEEGLSCVGSPILGRHQELIAAISISGPAGRIRSNRAEIIEEIKKTAQAISYQLY